MVAAASTTEERRCLHHTRVGLGTNLADNVLVVRHEERRAHIGVLTSPAAVDGTGTLRAGPRHLTRLPWGVGPTSLASCGDVRYSKPAGGEGRKAGCTSRPGAWAGHRCATHSADSNIARPTRRAPPGQPHHAVAHLSGRRIEPRAERGGRLSHPAARRKALNPCAAIRPRSSQVATPCSDGRTNSRNSS